MDVDSEFLLSLTINKVNFYWFLVLKAQYHQNKVRLAVNRTQGISGERIYFFFLKE